MLKSPENHSSSQATAPTGDFIRIRGARQHNLQNLNLDLPRNRLIVITGPSGSGKSSLAFDTLFAEGQRKYLESLSVQARQFLERLPRADVDQISGLPPSIAIAQESLAGNPRSTVATITEIYDYLRVLFSITGRPYDPLTGEPLRRLTVSEIVNEIKKSPQKSKIWILATIARDSPPPHNPILSRLKREGFLRARINRTLLELDDPKAIAKFQSVPVTIEVVVDRLILQGDLTARLTDSIELALRLGKGQLTALFWQEEFHAQPTEKIFSTDYRNPQTGYRLPQFTPRHFSYNSLEGACPSCSGLGYIEAPDVELILDPELSFSQGAFRFLKALPPTIQKTLQIRIAKIIENLGFPQTTPIKSLPPDVLQTLLYGKKSSLLPEFEGILPFLDRLHRQAESSQLRRKLKSFFSRQVCPECSGARLRPEPLCVFLETSLGKRFNISQFCKLNVAEALSAAKSLIIDKNIEKLAFEIVSEIASRLEFLSYAGLSYLGLDRESSTLSGGEARRVRLAAQLGASLSGVLYVLDEPSIGLHPRDHARLLDMLRRLRDSGNTIVVVEHDEQTIRSADYLIDMGPGAGPNGGKIVAQGTLPEILSNPNSLTASFLTGQAKRSQNKRKYPPPKDEQSGVSWFGVRGASEHNLKNIDVRFPVGRFSCVSGVSGSGKSTLVHKILAPALLRKLHGAKCPVGKHREIFGTENFDKVIVVDQSPIGRSPRSNPATYTGIFDLIRELFAQLPESRSRGYGPKRFSLNVPGGRCERCQGEGYVRLEMQFLPDAYVECDACLGRRFNRETLEVTYKERNIADVLEMTAEEAAVFFRTFPKISQKLEIMKRVGLGYLRLGQPANTLSGGESQRLKLAAELGRKATGKTLYLLDEPTTGLHFADIQALLEVLLQLRDAGNTIIVIEHNLDVLQCADYIVDLGPEAGENGGQIVISGPPEVIANSNSSHTGKFLKKVLLP